MGSEDHSKEYSDYFYNYWHPKIEAFSREEMDAISNNAMVHTALQGMIEQRQLNEVEALRVLGMLEAAFYIGLKAGEDFYTKRQNGMILASYIIDGECCEAHD